MEDNHQALPEKCYERGMNHNYMILSSYDFFGQEEREDYAVKMLLGNKIPGLLPVVCRRNAGKKQYCYEINSLQSLDRIYERQEIGYAALHKLLIGMIRIFEHLEEYLLDGTQIILKPEYIYLHMESGEPFFVCYPEYKENIRNSFTMLMDYLLTKIDHTQEKAVWLSYQVYRYTRNPNYVLSELKELVFEAQEMGRTSRQEMDYDKAGNSLREAAEYEAKENVGAVFYTDNEEEYDTDIEEANKGIIENDPKRRNIWGGMLCMLLALSAGGVILGSRILHWLPLSQKQEISLYGAVGMSVAAAVIFFVSLAKQWKQETNRQSLAEEPEEIDAWEQEAELPIEPVRNTLQASEQRNIEYKADFAGETVVLNEESGQERFLQGNINGEELRIPLKHFPLLLGKLAEVSDIIIPDNTVSRMHARLDQRNGRIYISDLNSTNGTKRNGSMIDMNEEVALEPGDKITLGRVCFTYY